MGEPGRTSRSVSFSSSFGGGESGSDGDSSSSSSILGRGAPLRSALRGSRSASQQSSLSSSSSSRGGSSGGGSSRNAPSSKAAAFPLGGGSGEGGAGDAVDRALAEARKAIQNADVALTQNVEQQANELSGLIAETEQSLDRLLDDWKAEQAKVLELERKLQQSDQLIATAAGGDNKQLVKKFEEDQQRYRKMDDRMDNIAKVILELVGNLNRYKVTMARVQQRQREHIDKLKSIRSRLQQSRGGGSLF